MIKKLSLKGFAAFTIASPTKKVSILHDYKYPSSNNAHAKIIYYQKARNKIVEYHKLDRDESWLENEAMSIDSLVMLSTGPSKTRLKNNARGLRQYSKYFADKKFIILDDFNRKFIIDDVSISVRPDLHILENGIEKLIKFEFTEIKPKNSFIKIINQCMYEAANTAGLMLPASSILLFDIPRGETYHLAKEGKKPYAEIKDTCQTISTLWDTI